MALRSQRQVVGRLDLVSGKALGEIAKAHKEKVEQPIRDAIHKAKSSEELLSLLDGSLLKRMNTAVVADAAEKVIVTSSGIGVVTAAKKK